MNPKLTIQLRGAKSGSSAIRALKPLGCGCFCCSRCNVAGFDETRFGVASHRQAYKRLILQCGNSLQETKKMWRFPFNRSGMPCFALWGSTAGKPGPASDWLAAAQKAMCIALAGIHWAWLQRVRLNHPSTSKADKPNIRHLLWDKPTLNKYFGGMELLSCLTQPKVHICSTAKWRKTISKISTSH